MNMHRHQVKRLILIVLRVVAYVGMEGTVLLCLRPQLQCTEYGMHRLNHRALTDMNAWRGAHVNCLKLPVLTKLTLGLVMKV